MKKFLNIRNVLVIIVMVLVCIYIFCIRSNEPNKSKTASLFYDLVNKDVLTYSMSFKENNKEGSINISFDKNNNTCVELLELYDRSNSAKETNTSHIKNITIKKDNISHSYQLNYDTQSYFDFGEVADESDITTRIEVINSIVSESKYFNKEYESINNELLYKEIFPEKGYTFYYKDNDLKYIKYNNGISGDNNTLYSVEIKDNFIDKSLIEIPSNFTKKSIE